MTANKWTIQKYMDGFRKTDHAQILSCLTEDIEWEVPGYFHLNGKDSFDKEIENEMFVGSPEIDVTLLIEEDNIVVAEGTVHSQKRDGGTLNAVFCDVFVMHDTKIQRITSYLMEIQ